MSYCKRKNEPTDTVHCLNCERFNRECKGEIKTKDGNVIKQMSLFD